MYPKLGKPRWKESFVALYCSLSFILGLSMVTEGGMYVFQLLDYYGASGMCLLWVCFFQSVVIAWVYGVDRFYDNIEQMIGYRINPWLRICWTVLTPLLTASIFFFMWATFEPVTYNRTYKYPPWAQVCGILLALVSMICIPVGVLVSLLTTRGATLKQKWKRLTIPILLPQRVPSHWKDGDVLKIVGCQHIEAKQTRAAKRIEFSKDSSDESKGCIEVFSEEPTRWITINYSSKMYKK